MAKKILILLMFIIVVSCCGIMISCSDNQDNDPEPNIVFDPPKVVTYMNEQVQHDRIEYKALEGALLPTEPHKPGYTFAGWVQRATVDGITNEDKFNLAIFLEKGSSIDYTVYAKFTQNDLILSFNVNGGTEFESIYGKTFDNIFASEKKDSSFAGWYVDAGLTTRVQFPLTLTQDTTIHAKWIAVENGLKYSYIDNGYQLVKYSGEGGAIKLDKFDGLPIVSIGAEAFIYKYITEINIPSTVTSIGASAFHNTNIATIHIPKSVTSIGNKAFYKCKLLTSITFEEGSTLDRIGRETFFDCEKLTSFVVPASVKVIDTNVFNGCTALDSVEFPINSKWGVADGEDEEQTNIEISDSKLNATNLKEKYLSKFWLKKV